MYEYWTWGWVKTYNELRWINLFRSHSHLFHGDVGIPWPLPGRFAASKEPEAQAGRGRRGWTWWGERGIRADGAHVCEGGREGRELLSFGIREIRSWATRHAVRMAKKTSQHSVYHSPLTKLGWVWETNDNIWMNLNEHGRICMSLGTPMFEPNLDAQVVWLLFSGLET